VQDIAVDSVEHADRLHTGNRRLILIYRCQTRKPTCFNFTRIAMLQSEYSATKLVDVRYTVPTLVAYLKVGTT
jgi:hypothetical protein